MTEYSEPELVLPALQFIRDNPGATTTEIKEYLIGVFYPSGYDSEILTGRHDTKFTQIVRNLKSHDTLTKHNWVSYQRVGRNGIWTVTYIGRQHLRAMGY